ncbi:MAG: hypothetical protein KGR26_15975, partial [Cyanobacteria bacterium REEB65]|nr:hypothetical protein [Cyanobacteria bacterium REEB65]
GGAMTNIGIGSPDRSRRGDWIQVCDGNRFWPLDPRPEEVGIDVAERYAADEIRMAQAAGGRWPE